MSLAIVVFVGANLVFVLLCSFYNLYLLLQYLRHNGPDPAPLSTFAEADFPRVTIQLPVYNEGKLAGQILRCAAALDYPHDKLEIQYLDDSDDQETSMIAMQTIEELALAYPAITFQQLARTDRKGFKAGALENGTKHASGEFFAIFDADFQIPADFLRHLMPYFTDPKVGAVQARWDYTNADDSLLLRLQANKLDVHQMVDQSGRARAGLTPIFHGTAGIWRKEALMAAGGWDSLSEVEDVELTIKAAILKWEVRYLDRYRVVSELPETLVGFARQQMRWRRGWSRVALAFSGKVWRADIPLRQRVDLLLRINLIWGSISGFIITLGVLPFLSAVSDLGYFWHGAAAYWMLLAVALVTRYYEDRMLAEYPNPRPPYRLPWFLTYLPLSYIINAMGLMWILAQATVEGFRSGQVWEVTPKSGTTIGSEGHAHITQENRVPLYVKGTLFLSILGIGLMLISLWLWSPIAALFYSLMAIGGGYVGLQLLEIYRPSGVLTRFGKVFRSV